MGRSGRRCGPGEAQPPLSRDAKLSVGQQVVARGASALDGFSERGPGEASRTEAPDRSAEWQGFAHGRCSRSRTRAFAYRGALLTR
jgi:hypothetical protein